MDNSETPVYLMPRIDFSNGYGLELIKLINPGTSYILFSDPRGEATEDSTLYAKNVLSFDGGTLHAEEVGIITFTDVGSDRARVLHQSLPRAPINFSPVCYTGEDIQAFFSRNLEKARQPIPKLEEIAEQI